MGQSRSAIHRGVPGKDDKRHQNISSFPFFFFFADERYFVGAHLAELLRRETFNVYGSFKRRNIALWRGDEALLHFLLARGVVFAGTTSVTLVRVNDAETFVTTAMEDIEVSKGSL